MFTNNNTISAEEYFEILDERHQQGEFDIWDSIEADPYSFCDESDYLTDLQNEE